MNNTKENFKDTNKNFSSWIINVKRLQNGGTIICNGN